MNRFLFLLCMATCICFSGCHKNDANKCQDPNALNYLAEPQNDQQACRYAVNAVFYTTTGYADGRYILPVNITVAYTIAGHRIQEQYTLHDSASTGAAHCDQILPSLSYQSIAITDSAVRYWVATDSATGSLLRSGTLSAGSIQTCIPVLIR